LINSTEKGADANGNPNGKYYFLRAEYFVKYCLEVFPEPDITITHQQVLNGAQPATALGANHGLYLFLPTPDFAASGHCDFWYYSSLGFYKAVAGDNFQYVNPLYFWIL